MPSPYLISASILSADLSRLGEQIQEAETAGVDWIHVDVMDGHFVPNLTMGPVIVEACRKVTQLPLDVHLMVESPENLLAAFAHAGSNILSVHVETCPHLHRTVQNIHELGCKAGVVLNPATPVDLVLPILPMIDLVLVMSVNPGFSGQSFIPDVMPKYRHCEMSWLKLIIPPGLKLMEASTQIHYPWQFRLVPMCLSLPVPSSNTHRGLPQASSNYALNFP